MSDHLMLVPSLDCPAKCKYCFGPNSGGAVMDIDTVEHVIEWENNRERNESLEITFHGGEPLIAGPAFYSQALEMLSREFSHRKVRFSIQSNLWNLDDDLCALFIADPVVLDTD